jgi:hypothetical protein
MSTTPDTTAKRGRKSWSPPTGIDWSRPALHIARECGVCVHTVLRQMRLQGLPIRPRGVPEGQLWSAQNRKRQGLDASSLDWSRQDAFLAKLHGLSHERIRQLRMAARKPASGSAEWLEAGGVITNPIKRRSLAVDQSATAA